MSYMSKIPYLNMVGSLMYAMICTRIDLAYPMSFLSRYMKNLDKAHWEALKWVLKYVKGSLNHDLKYGGEADVLNDIIKGYTNYDFAKFLDSKKIPFWIPFHLL